MRQYDALPDISFNAPAFEHFPANCGNQMRPPQHITDVRRVSVQKSTRRAYRSSPPNLTVTRNVSIALLCDHSLIPVSPGSARVLIQRRGFSFPLTPAPPPCSP
ncbi:hypothetical protein BaRGS_00010764 [Batillaria attramentaria]|uniref:Uncharacterized protein n=1 Tax=Batillaria attramentaria TaxID=370345 RepID=A0ABD0LF65_9CAEN